jgi:hypothetical protein
MMMVMLLLIARLQLESWDIGTEMKEGEEGNQTDV